MSWIVLGEDKGKIKLVSKSPGADDIPGLLPKGSYLTIENKKTSSKFILRVDESNQYEPYKPSPLVIDMDLQGLYGDTRCQNIISAYRVKDISNRDDGKIDFIPPQSIARRSTQEEIDIAFGGGNFGPKVFLATIHSGQNQLLIDDEKKFITARIPEEAFFHQMLISGKTGSGKTVAMKYLVQYFIEKMEGAVLTINVKDVDFLKMDAASNTNNPHLLSEWNVLGQEPHGISDCTIYYPANTEIESFRGVNYDICERITLNVKTIEPESLTGLLQNISEIGSQNFPDLFRFWQEKVMAEDGKFSDFADYFNNGMGNPVFETLNGRGDISSVTLHRGTFNNISRNLNSALEFFDNKDATTIDYDDILYPGKLSVINVAGEKGIQFGSILLRHLLKRIVSVKSQKISDVPILIVIDEVHQFYSTESSRDALGDLDTICRTGRSQKIGVVFASQNQNDIPKGLLSVINSKIYFKTDGLPKTLYGISSDEIQTLSPGYAVANIHNMSQLRTIKFPLSFAGVSTNEE
jgi:uncharacterized protein